MNRLLHLIAACCFTIIALGQAPEKFQYQTVVRDNLGAVLANQNVSFRLNIIKSNPNGIIQYSESHNATTNDFGLVNLAVGGGTVLNGNFTSIDWGTDLHFLQLEFDPAGGSSFSPMGTTQLLSVPYALSSKMATSMELNDLINVQGNPANGQILKWDGANWIPANDSTGGAPIVYSAGNGIAISGGNVISADLGTDIATSEIQNAAVTNAKIANNAVGSNQLINGAVTAAKLDQMAASNGEVLKWNGVAWQPQTDNAGASYSAGTGIAFSGGNVISADLGTDISTSEIQSNAVTTAKINNGAVTGAKIDQMAATNGQVLKWNGSTWLPQNDNAGTTYIAGTGINITGSTIANTAPDQTVSLTGAGATSISGTYPNFTITSTDNVNDADNNPTNELQSLSLSATTLSLSPSGGSVNLSAFSPIWGTSGSNIFYNSGNVGIGDNSPAATLTVGNGDKLKISGSDGDIEFSDDQGSLRFANASGSSAPMIQMFQSGTNNATRMLLAHSPAFNNWGIRYNDTTDAFTWIGDNLPVLHVQLAGQQRVGVGTETPTAKFHVSTNSSTGFGHVKLTETQLDYSRITMNNNIHSNFWDIAAITDTNLSNAKFNIYHSDAGDIFTVNARKRVGINDASPAYPLEVNGNGETRTINLYNTAPTTTGSTFNYGVICNMAQASNTGFPRLFNIYGFSTDSDSYLSYGVYGFASNASNFNYGIYGVAGTTGGYAGYFSGNTYCSGSYVTSDETFKTDIKPLSSGLATIMALNPKTYSFDTETYDYMNLPEGIQFGFVAQDLEAVTPNLVARAFQAFEQPTSNTHEGQGIEFKAVNYDGLIPVLTSAIQEQQAIIENQQKQIDELKSLVEKLAKQ